MASAAPDLSAKLRPVRCELLGLDRARLAVITVIADDILPEVVMYEGEPFLLDTEILGTAYRKVVPFRVG